MADMVLPWDTYLDGNESLTTGPAEALRIRKIGTDKTSSITPQVNGNELGAIRTEVGTIHNAGSTEQGMLDLGDLYYYVPPESTVELNGVAGDLVRVQGEWLDTPNGRFDSSGDETRFSEQGSWHWTFTQGSVDVAEAIADGAEFTIHQLTPNTDERYEFNGIQMVSQSSGGDLSVVEDQVSIFYEFDGQQRPSQFGNDSIIGVDLTSMPRPPTDTSEQNGFVFGEQGPNVSNFVMTGDQTLQVRGKNVSGGSLDSTTSNTSTFTFTAAVRFRENV